MQDLHRLFDEPKPEIYLPVDLEAEIRAKGDDALPIWAQNGGLLRTLNVTVTECIPVESREGLKREVQYCNFHGDDHWENPVLPNDRERAKEWWALAGREYGQLIDGIKRPPLMRSRLGV